MASNFDKLLDGMQLSLNNQDSAKQVVELALDRISSDPNNPRQSFDGEALKDLAASISARGVLQPILVRPAGEEGRFIVCTGDRRFRASKLAGLATIPAIVTETGDDGETLVDQVIENDQRVDLTAAELAAAVGRLLKSGLKQAEIGRQLGRPRALIAMYAAVSTMPDFLSGLANTLAIRTLYELNQAYKLDPARTEKFVAQREGGSITTNEARALVKDIEDRAAEAEKRLSEQTNGVASPDATPAVEAADTAKPARAKAKSKVVPLAPIFVDVNGRRGRLVLPAMVSVLFEGESEPATHKLDDLRPVSE